VKREGEQGGRGAGGQKAQSRRQTAGRLLTAFCPLPTRFFPLHSAYCSRAISVRGRDFIQSIWRDITERKRAEEHLAYQAYLLANVHDAIIATDKQLVIKAWNRAAEKMYGWKAKEILGRNVFEFLGSESTLAQCAQAIRTLAETGRVGC
jgi:PAS domain-containing protein